MPNKKRFEAMSLSVPFNVEYLDMYEAAELTLGIIKRIFDLLVEGARVTVEVSENDESDLYEISKESEDVFVLHSRITDKTERLKPIEFYNWVFANAPFIPAVGQDNS